MENLNEITAYFNAQPKNKLFCFLDNKALVKKYGLDFLTNALKEYCKTNKINLLTRSKTYFVSEPFNSVDATYYMFWD